MPPRFTDPLPDAMPPAAWLRTADLVIAVLVTLAIAFGMSFLTR